MSKFCISPAFNFNHNLVGWLKTNGACHDDGRILVYPITQGMRLRNIADTRSVELEVSAPLVHMHFTVNQVNDTVYTCITDMDTIGEKLIDFFKE